MSWEFSSSNIQERERERKQVPMMQQGGGGPPPYYHPESPNPTTYASAPPYQPPPSSSDYYSSPNPNPNPNLQQQQSYQSYHQSYNPPPPPSSIPNYNSNSFQYPPPPVYDTSSYHNTAANYVSDIAVDYHGNRSGMSTFESTPPTSYQGDAVYAYQGPKAEPYGSRGTSTWKQQLLFDDFGRPIGKDSPSPVPKIVKAVPKPDTRQDVKAGLHKFRVNLLPETAAQTTMDVLCQVGLDGIRMLDPSTSRTLRIYSLDTVTRCEVYDSSTFAFWSKSSVDIEPRRIRLQSNSYTTNTLLDTVTAATFQVKEMGGRSRPVDAVKVTEQSTEKKKGLGDWMNIIKPPNEEKDHWVPDEAVTKCTGCGSDFSAFNRKHHCRNCGDIFCDKCTHGRIALTSEENAPQVRVCDRCMLEVTHRLSSAKEAAASRSSGLQSHEDLAKKLQEELERNHKPSSGFKSEGSSRRMKEVACPTCTVHLQVQVPSSGSETIECGVCQHPFLVSR